MSLVCDIVRRRTMSYNPNIGRTKKKRKIKRGRETNEKTGRPKRKDEGKEYKKEKKSKQQNGKERKEGQIEKEQTEKAAE